MILIDTGGANVSTGGEKAYSRLIDSVADASGAAFASRQLTAPLHHDSAVCVLQREAAILSAASRHCYVGSCEATTCVIAFLYNRHAKAALVAHIDDESAAAAFALLVNVFMDRCRSSTPSSTDTLELSLVGSFGTLAESRACVAATLDELQGVHVAASMRLVLAVVLNHNCRSGMPIFTSAAIDVSNGIVYPAAFASPGPGAVARQARLWTTTANELPLVFDSNSTAVMTPSLGPCVVTSAMLQRLLALDDAELVAATSTSPSAEAADFATSMRDVLCLLLQRVKH